MHSAKTTLQNRTPKTTAAMAADNKPVLLPQDIIETILSKSPVKSLLRFKSVSKSWKTLISDSIFVRKHLQHSSQKSNLLLWKSNQWSPRLSLIKFENGKFQTLQELQESPDGWGTVCFCNGVFLLTDCSNNKYILWNPSTQSKTMISFPYRFTSHPKAYGISYDPSTTCDDFKIVIISSSSMKDYAVFSSKTKTWIKKKKGFTSTYVIDESGICVNGFIYWVYRQEEDDVRRIVYFDPRDDQLKILQKPEDLEDDKRIFLISFKGRLYVYCTVNDNETVIPFWTSVRFWIRENDCWREAMTIKNVRPFYELQFLAEDRVVARSKRLTVYNVLEKIFKEYDERVVFGYDLVPYVDTLFFPIESTRPKRKRKCLVSDYDYEFND